MKTIERASPTPGDVAVALDALLGTHTATERPGLESPANGLQTALPGIESLALRETPFE